MIKILRTSCPACLDKPDQDFVEKDYKRMEVKTDLSNMQHGKCCYCERNLNDLGWTEREVEHHIPKRAYKDMSGNIQWHLANKWENLLYACRSCNSDKGTQMPYNDVTGEPEIINPCCEAIDPEDHIDFIIEDSILIFFKERNGSSLGRSTIEKLKFHERCDLFGEFRRMKLNIDKQIVELVNSFINKDSASVVARKNELSRATSAHHPFAAFSRKYITKRIEEVNAQRPILKTKYGVSFQGIDIHICKGYETKM